MICVILFSIAHIYLEFTRCYYSEYVLCFILSNCLLVKISEIFALNHGVPQGSCLGPLLFIIYASEMFSVIESLPPSSHGYADDTQLYCSINPYCADTQVVSVQDMENCISDVRDWTTASKLKMNDDKTECMLIGTRQQLAKVSLDKISW